MNRVRLLAIAWLAGFVVAGFFIPTGVIMGVAAEHFSVSVPVAAKWFSALTGGLFLGFVASFFIYDYLRLKIVIIVGYITVFFTVISIHYIESLSALFSHLLLIGFFCGLVSCASSTIIAGLWSDRKRQMGLVGQDAMFNAGGVVLSFVAGFSIDQQYSWNATYWVVSGVLLLVILLALISSFEELQAPDDVNEADEESKTEWNIGIFVAGIGLLLFMFAKTVVIVWMPQFVQQIFLVDGQKASQVMSNVYSAAFVGSVCGTYIASKIKIIHFLITLVLLAIISMWLLIQHHSIDVVMWLAYALGASIAATLHAYMAFGFTFVTIPTHRHVAFYLLLAGLGAAVAPYISGQLVLKTGDVTTSMYLSFSSFVAVLVMLAGACLQKNITDKHQDKEISSCQK